MAGGLTPAGLGGWCPRGDRTVRGYLAAVQERAGRVAAVYGVGALASVTSATGRATSIWWWWRPRLEMGRVAGAARRLRHAGRGAQVWHVTWADLDRDGPGFSADGTPAARREAWWGLGRLAGWWGQWGRPVGHAHDPGHLPARPDGVVRSGLAGGGLRPRRLSGLGRGPAAGPGGRGARAAGLPPGRGAAGPEAARLAQAVLPAGWCRSPRPGNWPCRWSSTRHQRLLTDAVGYRHGAHSSMYWGPFERKYDALGAAGRTGRSGPAGPALTPPPGPGGRAVSLAPNQSRINRPPALLARSVPS